MKKQFLVISLLTCISCIYAANAAPYNGIKEFPISTLTQLEEPPFLGTILDNKQFPVKTERKPEGTVYFTNPEPGRYLTFLRPLHGKPFCEHTEQCIDGTNNYYTSRGKSICPPCLKHLEKIESSFHEARS